jgi:adenylate cyclase
VSTKPKKSPSNETGGASRSGLRRFGVALSTLVLAAGITAQVREPEFIGNLRDAAFDGYQQAIPRPYQPAPVRIVDIDEASLSRLGQWPWPRTRVAEMVAKLRDLGAASVAFDILFSEPDRTSPDWLAEEWNPSAEVRASLATLPDHDRVLAAEFGRGNAVTAFALTAEAGLSSPPDIKARFIRMGDPGPLPLHRHAGVVKSMPLLEEAASGNGFINFSPGRDGVVRRVPLLLELQGELYPSLLAESLRVATGLSNYTVVSKRDDDSPDDVTVPVYEVRVGSIPIPTDATGHVRVYLTEPVEERYVPAWRVLAGEAEGLIPENALIFVGSSATGLKDLRFGTLGEVIPGVEVHAQIVEQILTGTYISRPPWALLGEVLLVVGTWAAMLLLGLSGRAMATALAAISGIAASVSWGWYSWSSSLLLIDPVTPSIVIVGTFLAYIAPQLVASESEQRWMRNAFSNYLSPNLVDHLIRNPGELKLGGERRECSFVLTDVADFTALVENSDPVELSDTINAYLDGMVSIAFKFDGTLDRIVGDAVAVLFSAPVTQPDHAERAVACALEMNAFATQYAGDCQQRGIPFGLTRIGVHTGEVVVGNFGGSTHFDYRPLGDPINTSARLETVNRQLGTQVCVSGVTVAACREFHGRPAGELLLKGKTVPLAAWELLTPEQAASPHIVAYCAAFELLDSDPEAALVAFRGLVENSPDDPLAALHLKRLERGETGKLVVFREK